MLNYCSIKGVVRPSIVFFCVCMSGYAGQRWPRIQETKMSFHFVSEKNEEFKATIYDKEGSDAYHLDCRFNAWKYNAPDYSFSGMLDCRLLPSKVDDGCVSYSTLFQDVAHATRDWESGGRFTGDELLGSMDSGAFRPIVRKFRLRGMRVILEVKNVGLNYVPEAEINELDLEVVFLKDPAAKGAYVFSPVYAPSSRRPVRQ